MLHFAPINQDEDFARRTNLVTGLIESICLYCYATIAEGTDLEWLKLEERQLDCPGKHPVEEFEVA